MKKNEFKDKNLQYIEENYLEINIKEDLQFSIILNN